MRAFQITQFGLENLHLVDLPTPACGDGMVLIRVHATSLNYRDLLMVRGIVRSQAENAADSAFRWRRRSRRCGRRSDPLQTGDRVVGFFLQNWQDGGPSREKSRGGLGGDIDGMLADYVALPEHGVSHFPAHLSYEEAATLPCAALTAWNALFHVASTKPGDTIVIQGTGGVSIFALQFAKLVGARVLGTSSSDEKLERAKLLGLDEGLNYKNTPDWSSWVKKQTSGEGADVIVEVGGGGTYKNP